MSVSTSPNQHFVPSLQDRIGGLGELRGIAILVVLFAHFFNLRQFESLKDFHLGGIGVDLFFVISGYLIAKILIASRDSNRYFRKFYVRRAFRILPLYIVVVTSVLLLRWGQHKGIASWPFYLTFTQNFLHDPSHPGLSLVGTDYSAFSGLGPLWSLAIEEQFYLLMPLLILCIPSRWLPSLFFAIGLAGLWFSRASLHESNGWLTYPNPWLTWMRIHALTFGAILNFPNRWRYLIPSFLGWGTLNLISGYQSSWLSLGLMMVIVVSVDLAVSGRFQLKNSILEKTGLLCYGLYVLHIPILIVTRPVLNSLKIPGGIGFIIFATLSLIAAYCSFHWFETPIQKLRTRFE